VIRVYDDAGNVIETREHAGAISRSGSAIKQPNLKGNRDF
jgi:hypothetical protein